jgi:hypothetical protein
MWFGFSSQLLSETFLIVRRIQRDTVTNVQRSAWRVLEYSLFFLDFNDTRISVKHFRKIPTYQIPRKSVQRETTCSMRDNGRTDGQARRS